MADRDQHIAAIKKRAIERLNKNENPMAEVMAELAAHPETADQYAPGTTRRKIGEMYAATPGAAGLVVARGFIDGLK
jgi:hypothetical protein